MRQFVAAAPCRLRDQCFPIRPDSAEGPAAGLPREWSDVVMQLDEPTRSLWKHNPDPSCRCKTRFEPCHDNDVAAIWKKTPSQTEPESHIGWFARVAGCAARTHSLCSSPRSYALPVVCIPCTSWSHAEALSRISILEALRSSSCRYVRRRRFKRITISRMPLYDEHGCFWFGLERLHSIPGNSP